MSFQVYESTENYLLQTKLPGLDASKLELSIENQTLSIKGNRKSSVGKALVKELAQAAFNKRVQLPQNVDLDAIQADYQKGLLSITLPKRTKRIEIKVA